MARIERELRLKQTFKSQKNRRPVEIRQLANLNVEDWRLMVRVNDPEAWQKVKNWWRFGKPVTDAALKKEVEQKKEELSQPRAMDGREYSEAKIDCMDTREVLYTYDRYRLGVDAGVARSRPDMPDMPAMSAMGGMIPPRGLYVDVTGKVHGDLPKRIPKEWSKEDLRDSADALKKSIQTRQAEQVRLGEDAGQRLRLKASALTPNSKKAEWKLVVLNLYEQDRKNH